MKSAAFFLVLCLAFNFAAWAQTNRPVTPSGITPYLITNDDSPPKVATSGTFFTLATDGTPDNPVRVSLGGVGAGGGYFAAGRVSTVANSIAHCAYLSLGGSSEVSAVDIRTLQDIGNFSASLTDSSFDNGMGLVNNGHYLFASFSTSNTIAAFSIQSGCGLQFLGSAAALGSHGGGVKGMAVHGNLLVVANGDGSIQSFNVSAGTPVSNNDLQDATGFATDRYPNGVDITKDGHYAIFGDMSTTTTVEVSDISSGKLTKTVLYNLGPAANSNNVLLSPDETLLYIANNSVGRVTAAFFNKTTGKISTGCTSRILKGFDNNWVWLSSPVTEHRFGTGSPLYLAEFGSISAIAIVDVSSNAGKCTLTETSPSPIQAPNTTNLLSIGFYPPRTF